MASLAGARSYLFVPATDEHRVDKALASAAHAVIVELEDAVAEDRKEDARALVARRLRQPRPRGAQLVRINGLDTAHARRPAGDRRPRARRPRGPEGRAAAAAGA